MLLFKVQFYLWSILAMNLLKVHDLCNDQFGSRPRDILRLCFHFPSLSSLYFPLCCCCCPPSSTRCCSPWSWACGWYSSLSGPRSAWKGRCRCSPAKITWSKIRLGGLPRLHKGRFDRNDPCGGALPPKTFPYLGNPHQQSWFRFVIYR